MRRLQGHRSHDGPGGQRVALERNGNSQNGADKRPVLITGGAGFIGTNLAHRLLSAKKTVLLLDNLSRTGVEQNLAWLRATHGDQVRHIRGDVRNAPLLREVLAQVSQVFHFAAQVAVTTSLGDPIEDFDINARGTLNLLEGLRALAHPPPLVFTSTNKVYGDLGDVKLRLRRGRYEPQESCARTYGFSEARPLHFHSPYGCSKGAACQYVLDYARTFGLPTVVFRMSCIYGPHQFGNEDQGWIAHFLIRALGGQPVTIYGNGCQVRDILYVEDLVDAFLLAQKHIGKLSGQAFNIGGGPRNTISLRELMSYIMELRGIKPKVRWADWRAADQRYYVSDTRKFSDLCGWTPTMDVREGIHRLYDWLKEFRRSRATASVSRGGIESHSIRKLKVSTAKAPAGFGSKKGFRLRIVQRSNGHVHPHRNGRKRFAGSGHVKS